MELCTATNVIILCIVLFLYNLFTSVSLLVDSPIGHGGELSEELNIGPLWDRGQNFSICSYLSTSKYFSSIQLSKKQTLFHHKNVVFTNHGSEDDIKIKINIQDEKYAGLYRNDLPLQHDSIDAFASESIWSLIRGNKTTIYLHVLLLKQQNKQHLLSGIGSYNDDDSDFLDSDGYPDRIDQNLFAKGNGLHSALSLLKMAKIPTSYADRYLLSDAAKSSIWKTCDRFSSGLLSKYLITPISVIEQTQQELWKKNPNEIVTFWKPEVIVRTVNDWTLWSMETIPDALIRNLIQINENGDMYRYKPHIHVDEIGITSDKFIALNSTSGQQGGLPLMISYGKLSLHHWLFSSAIEDGMKVQKDSIGFGDKDLDDVRRLFTDTPLWLLAITVLASCLHLLFELLAFQSDIDFWKNNQSLTGLSARALVTDLISQSIVFLFLYNSDTSLIVLGPALVGILIQFWKVQKATGLCLTWNKGVQITRLSNNKLDNGISEHSDRLLEATLEADSVATTHLVLAISPLIIGTALWSLLTEKHRSWYCWFISALTASVYFFGFALMTPQLYINYKLQSVAHLPWKFLAFRFTTTFIDDLFAFVIKMPTMHRISCFRDDLIFMIYLYQRWCYKIDSSRPSD